MRYFASAAVNNAIFPVPIETWLAISGIAIFCVGLLYGFIASIQSIVTLLSKKRRQTVGMVAPILTLLIAVFAWTVVVNATLNVVHSLQQRTKAEGAAISSFLSQPSSTPRIARNHGMHPSRVGLSTLLNLVTHATG